MVKMYYAKIGNLLVIFKFIVIMNMIAGCSMSNRLLIGESEIPFKGEVRMILEPKMKKEGIVPILVYLIPLNQEAFQKEKTFFYPPSDTSTSEDLKAVDAEIVINWNDGEISKKKYTRPSLFIRPHGYILAPIVVDSKHLMSGGEAIIKINTLGEELEKRMGKFKIKFQFYGGN